MTAKRITGLDLLRAAAILMVLAAHFPKPAGSGPAFRVLNFGWAGVDLFFVLSGYLIGRQAIRHLDIRTFYLSRLLRTLPCYYAVLALYFLTASPEPAWKFLTFTQNFGIPSAFTPSWSLCVEEHFYLVFPIALAFALRFGGGRTILWGAGAILVLEVAIRSALWLSLRPDLIPGDAALTAYMANFYYPTWCRLDGITLGVSLAALEHFYPALWQRLMSLGDRLTAAAALIFAAAAAALWQRYSYSCSVLGFTLLSASFAAFTAAALSPRSLLARLRIPGVATVALLSYSIYLTHALAIEAASHAARSIGIGPASLPGAALAAAAIAASAAILYLAVERPSLAVRSRVLAKKAATDFRPHLLPIGESS